MAYDPTKPSLTQDYEDALASIRENIADTRSGAAVSSVFGRSGAVVKQAGDYAVADVTGAAPLASPTFTGVPAAPTAANGTNTTQIATTAFVQAAVVGGGSVSSVFTRAGAVVAQSGDYTVAQVTGAAPLASPTFTGVPAAPTAANGTNTTQLATTAFVQNAVGAGGLVSSVFTRAGAVVAQSGDYTVAQVTGAAPTASPAFTGVPTAPTAAGGTNTTQIATTAFVTAAVAAGGSGTVTSVGLSAPAQFSVSGSPITVSGTLGLSWASQTARTFLAAPSVSGTPSFRAIDAADLPTNIAYLDATFPTFTGQVDFSQRIDIPVANDTIAIDVSNGQIRGRTLRLNTVSSDPTSGLAEGEIIARSGQGPKYYTGSAWKHIAYDGSSDGFATSGQWTFSGDVVVASTVRGTASYYNVPIAYGITLNSSGFTANLSPNNTIRIDGSGNLQYKSGGTWRTVSYT